MRTGTYSVPLPQLSTIAVDAHPVGGASGKVDPSIGVAVGQVTRPVHAVAHPLVGGGGIVVVPAEQPTAGGVDQLADRRVGVGQGTRLVEPCDVAFPDRL